MRAIVLLLLLLLFITAYGLSCQIRKNETITRYNGHGLGKWFESGFLERHYIVGRHDVPAWYSFISLCGNETRLSGDIVTLNRLFEIAIPPEEATRFVNGGLVNFLVRTDIIGKFLPESSARFQFQKLSESYNQTSVETDRFNVNVVVHENSGGVEKWQISGTLAPFCITRFTRTHVSDAKPDGINIFAGER